MSGTTSLPVIHLACGNCLRRLIVAVADYDHAKAYAEHLGWEPGRDGRWRCQFCVDKQDCEHQWREVTTADRVDRLWIPLTSSSPRGAVGYLICSQCYGLKQYDTGD